MSSRLMFASSLLFAIVLPMKARADDCTGAQPKPIEIASDAKINSSFPIQTGDYCFTLIFESAAIKNHASIQWDLQREALPLLGLESVTKDGKKVAAAEDGTPEKIESEKHLYMLNPGDKLVIKVWIDKPTSEDATHTLTYAVESSGRWQLGYGLLFLPGRDKEYFSRTVDDSFVIARKSRRNGMTFAPALLWSWAPTPSRNSVCAHSTFTCSFAAGIAADSSSPILFAGVQGTYHQNISFNLGVAVHQEKRLAGEYHEGQSLTESIDSDTLNKSVYRPNLYFGVSFRFDKSPF